MNTHSSLPRKVFQIGAAGGVGRRLTALLTAQGHQVSGMHRAGGQDRLIRAAGGVPVTGDLVGDSVDELARRITGHDTVVFSAGAHGTGRDMTTAIDGEGLMKAADAAALAGARRFVLVSVFMDALRDGPRSDGFEHYMATKRRADVYLAATDLDWLIVRPGTLLDEAGTGRVHAGLAIEYGSVSRDDVAAFIAAAVFEPALSRTIVELTAGKDAVADAVADLVRPAAGRATAVEQSWADR